MIVVSKGLPALLSSLVLAAVASGASAAEPVLRIDGLSERAPPRMLLFVVRGPEVQTPLVALQNVMRKTIDAHVHARVLSMEEAFVRGGDALEQKLRECKGEDACYTQYANAVDVQYLVVVGVRTLGNETLVSARLIDTGSGSPIGTAIDAVPAGKTLLDVIPDRLETAFPRELWDPYGELGITVVPEGAEIAINARTVGIAPLAPVGYLLPGTYRVRASMTGFETQEVTIEVQRRERTPVALQLTAVSTGLPWWVWVVGGVVVAGGAATGVALAASGSGPLNICSAPGDGCR